ncbi:hypothetical protein ETAA8_14000 [Anatilimnocola aggregata]|uniref:Uncharacterized protein n=1 Tax=Anatilimnocola aggregata TaxID=2528021 RepID=A0A517Y856_9BACT|nr:hypothetical protein [Anatilimnocola aggregata]QDU26322.1 hypothetical protein ETAA8_14000 [Anatilimnocola aggregata]
MIAVSPPTISQSGFASLSQRRWLALDPLVILPPLTILHLLVHAPQAWYLSVLLVPLFALGLIFRRWLHAPAFWYVTAMLLGATVYFNWESADNHKYLFVYWTLALCCTFSLPKSEWGESLARTSRLLIALCMILATVWKITTPQYIDARFFTFELLVDERFAHFTSWTTGVPLSTLAENRDLREQLIRGHFPGLTQVTLAGGAQVAPLAMFLTWWTVLIEGLLGILFFLPKSNRIKHTRNALLILFAVTTYSVAPVRGFGWMLMLLGLAQCEYEDRTYRWGYLAALLLIQAYTIPIGQLIGIFSGSP